VPDVAHTTLTQLRAHASDPFAWLLAIAIVLVTPLAEEVLWRGGVQQALKSVGLPRALALVIASALFALVHWNAVPADARAGALPALLMLGLLFGWLMERTGGLLAAVSAHAAFNAANLLLFSTLPG
jgi:membrane protease YdiL (CAAX protease family)